MFDITSAHLKHLSRGVETLNTLIFTFNDVTQVPQKWREHLNCCQCKQQIGTAFLGLVKSLWYLGIMREG